MSHTGSQLTRWFEYLSSTIHSSSSIIRSWVYSPWTRHNGSTHRVPMVGGVGGSFSGRSWSTSSPMESFTVLDCSILKLTSTFVRAKRSRRWWFPSWTEQRTALVSGLKSTFRLIWPDDLKNRTHCQCSDHQVRVSSSDYSWCHLYKFGLLSERVRHQHLHALLDHRIVCWIWFWANVRPLNDNFCLKKYFLTKI